MVALLHPRLIGGRKCERKRPPFPQRAPSQILPRTGGCERKRTSMTAAEITCFLRVYGRDAAGVRVLIGVAGHNEPSVRGL